MKVSVKVTNTGKTAGEEVVQLYIASQDGTVKAPKKALKGFERIFLKPSESRIVKFELSPEELSIVDNEGLLKPFTGKILVSAGGSQPDELNPTSGNIARKIVSIL